MKTTDLPEMDFNFTRKRLGKMKRILGWILLVIVLCGLMTVLCLISGVKAVAIALGATLIIFGLVAIAVNLIID